VITSVCTWFVEDAIIGILQVYKTVPWGWMARAWGFMPFTMLATRGSYVGMHDDSIIWRPKDHSDVTGNYNGDLEFKSWNETTATAVACWKDAPQYFGTMYDFYPQCNVWMVGHYQNEWDGWMWGTLCSRSRFAIS